MKIKNLAFFGVMAAILGVGNAAHADTATVIASQAYVDARDALKQDENKRYENTLATYNGLNKTEPEQKEDYPSMYTLKQAVGSIDMTSVVSQTITDGVTNKAPSEDAVHDALENKVDVDQGSENAKKVLVTNGEGTVVTAETLEEGQIPNLPLSKIPSITADATELNILDGATLSTTELNYVDGVTSNIQTQLDNKQDASDSTVANGSYAHITQGNGVGSNLLSLNNALVSLESAIEAGISESKYNDWIEAGRPREAEAPTWVAILAEWAAIDNVISDNQKDHQTKIPRNANIQKGILYMEGDGIGRYTETATPDKAKSWVKANGQGNSIKTIRDSKAMDKYVPTMAAVESRVLDAIDAAVSQAGTNVETVDSNALAQAAENNAKLTKVSAIKGMVANSGIVTGDTTNKTFTVAAGSSESVPTTATLSADLTAVKGAVDAKANIVSPSANSSANNLVTVNEQGIVSGYTAAGALAKKDKIGNSDVTPNDFAYTDVMDYQLSNVNAHGDLGSAYKNCTTESPCTLTMVWNGTKPKYEWTNMDTEGERADIAADNS